MSKSENGSGYLRVDGYRMYSINGRKKLGHQIIAEKILGRQLRNGEQIHHFDYNKLNNKHSNLVICPNNAYHKLLHQRQRAYEICGHPDWLKCRYCKSYDDPINLYVIKKRSDSERRTGTTGFHRRCAADHRREFERAKRLNQ